MIDAKMRPAEPGSGSPSKSRQEAVMRLIALGAVSAIATILSFGVEAADFAYPPSAVGSPQYGVAPHWAVAPPQGLVVLGAPVAVPRYNGAPVQPPVVTQSPYAEAPPVAPPGVAPGTSVPPRAACDPVWRCGNNGCGWGPGCAPHPENYPGPYGTPGPQVYSEAPRPPEPYSGPYGTPGPQIYSGPEVPPAPAPYSGPYAPQVYSGPTGRMRWMIGPQPYGL